MSPSCHGVPLLALVASLLAAPVAAPAEQASLAAGEVRVRAESYEQTTPGRVEARGLVDLHVADIRIQADEADVIEEKQPDGTTRQRIVAAGNVVFIRGEERLSGDRLEMDDTGKGTLLNAVGYLEPGVFVEARKIERLDADSYRIEGGTFTSCSQANSRWNFSASRAKVDVDKRITGTNAVFKVKGVPAFYTPYIYYPLSESRRSTGFLLPSVGYSSVRGYKLTTGFFWAMGRSADQTFWLDSYSIAGNGLGHELRWVGRSPSRWTLDSFVFDPKGSSKYDYSINWGGLQQLPGKLRASAELHLSSSTAFAQQYEGDSARGIRSSDWSVSLDRDFGFAGVSAYGRTTNEGVDGHVDGTVPGLGLRHSPRQIWGGLVFGLQGSAERIVYGTRPRVDAWMRYDFAPTLSRPLQVSFLEINPSVGYRYTRYGASVREGTVSPLDDESEEIDRSGPPVHRSFFETSIATRGPTFARVFDTPGFGYSDRFKHTIGPEITWTHRTPVSDFAAIPPSGKQDRLARTSQVDYALVQRFYAKRRGQSGRAMPYEFLSWRLAQTYYPLAGEGRAGVDPKSPSRGPIESHMTLRPTPQYSFDCVLEYDVSSRQVRHTSMSVSTSRPGLFLEASWERNLKSAVDQAKLRTADESLRDRSETLGGRTLLGLLSNRVTFEGEVDYDMVAQEFWHVRGLVRYSAQCCGFTVEHNWRRRDTGPPDAQWRFSIELANVGSIGGSPPARREGGGFGLGSF